MCFSHRAACCCSSIARRMPRRNSALSSKSEWPRLGVSFATSYVGVVGRTSCCRRWTNSRWRWRPAVREELSEQPQVGLGAAGRHPELEERLHSLLLTRPPGSDVFRISAVPVGTLAIDGATAPLRLCAGQRVHRVCSRRSFPRHLKGVTPSLPDSSTAGSPTGIRPGQGLWLGISSRVRAHEDALAALDAELLVPDWNFRPGCRSYSCANVPGRRSLRASPLAPTDFSRASDRPAPLARTSGWVSTRVT